jgi:hypothetical protein
MIKAISAHTKNNVLIFRTLKKIFILRNYSFNDIFQSKGSWFTAHILQTFFCSHNNRKIQQSFPLKNAQQSMKCCYTYSYVEHGQMRFAEFFFVPLSLAPL